jgi:hypothetical protein
MLVHSHPDVGEPYPVLCDVVGVLGPEVALTHDGDGAVVALDVRGVKTRPCVTWWPPRADLCGSRSLPI